MYLVAVAVTMVVVVIVIYYSYNYQCKRYLQQLCWSLLAHLFWY